MQSGLLRAFLLFVSSSILMQVYYLVNTWFNLWSKDFPWGYVLHVMFYVSIFAVTIFYVGELDLGILGIKFVNSWWRYVLIGFAFTLFHYATRILFIRGSFDRAYLIKPELYIPAFIFLGLLVGLSEESAFRGYIMKNFLESSNTNKGRYYKPAFAILLSSILFGIYHVYFIAPANPIWWIWYVLQAFTAGIFMGFLFYETGLNLLGPITYHSTNVIVGNIMPWTSFASPQYQLIVKTMINIPQILILIILKTIKMLPK